MTDDKQETRDERTFTVFVYGTLKGGKSAGYMLDGSDYCGPGVLKDYLMSSIAPPNVKPCKNGTGRVLGELYTVNEKTLARLDRYEGYGMPGGYTRKVISIVRFGEDSPIDAWVYMNENVSPHAPCREVWYEF